jgi:ankyrin repeat protein
MQWTKEQIEIGQGLCVAIIRIDPDQCRRLCDEHPWLIQDHTWEIHKGFAPTWLNYAVRTGDVGLVGTLLDLGFAINALNNKEQTTALSSAVSQGHKELAAYLLNRGADPNLSRPLIGALSSEHSPEKKMDLVRILIDNGAEVNRRYDLFGDASKQFTALDWVKDPEIVAYLKSKGAKNAAELTGRGNKPGVVKVLDEVVQYFQDNFGDVDQRSIIEIVPTGFPVSIHAIRPTGSREHLTLFTTGLSSKRMNTPSELSEFALAELFIQLPGDWKYESSEAQWHWPVEWLRRIAQYPLDNNTSLGGPITIIANDEPPKPLGPNTNFTSWLMIAEKSFERIDGETVQLYRVVPIYTDERELELREGAPALMRAFDRNDVPFIVDLNRPSVAKY